MNTTMEERNVSPASTGFKFGLIAGAVLVIYSLILILTEQFNNVPLSLLSYVLLIGLIVFAHKNFKEENNGFMTYGQGLGIGALLSMVAGFITGAFTFLYFRYIDDSAIVRQLEDMRYKFEDAGMDDAQIDQMIEMQEKIMPYSPLIGAFTMLVIGFILTLIIAAFTKKEKSEFE